jgi:hypothetical protein
MRTYSTPESAHCGEITKLAVIEAAMAVGLYVWICTYLDSWQSLAAIVLAAPLMLFRSEKSADWAVEHWNRWDDVGQRMERFEGWDFAWRILIYLVIAPFVGVALRVIGTVYWAVRSPLYTLREVPRNWLRQTLCTDFMHPPEIVPLEALRGDKNGLVRFVDFAAEIRAEPDLKNKLGILFLGSPLLFFGWLPSAVYRLSFKATAIVYAPFIWAVHATVQNALPLTVRLERITKGELEKVRRGFSYFILLGFAVKAGLSFGFVKASVIPEWFSTARAAEFGLMPGVWPWWQWTLVSDAVLTFILLFFADAALGRIEGGSAWPEQTVVDVTSFISFSRVTLSLLTIAHFFALALRIAFPAAAWPF